MFSLVYLSSWTGMPAWAEAANERLGGDAGTSPTEPFGTLGLVDSSKLPGVAPLLTGVLRNTKGSPAAGQVVAYAWPSNDALAAMSPGAEFRLTPSHGRRQQGTVRSN